MAVPGAKSGGFWNEALRTIGINPVAGLAHLVWWQEWMQREAAGFIVLSKSR